MSFADGDFEDIDATGTSANSQPSSTQKRRYSREFVYPAPQSRERQSTLYGAIFNLSATILGGGILSIPFCFQLCGLLFGSVFLVLIALASDFSVYLLISCSRRIRHGASYEEVVGNTFGKAMGRFVLVMMFALVYLCIVAYTILIRDLVTPLIELLFSTHYGAWGRFFIVAMVLILVMPLCLQKNLNSLGWISIVSIISMLILAYCVIYRGFQQLVLSYNEPYHERFHDGGLRMVPLSWNDAIYAAPIFACSYTCHFNVLPLHRELIHPTRPRIKKMINWVIALCSVLYLSVGTFGYIYARSQTDGNILNNFRVSDPLAVLGRVSLSFCLIGGFPMIVLPARQLLGKILLLVLPTSFLIGSSDNDSRSHSFSNSPVLPSRAPDSRAQDPHAEAIRALRANRSFQDVIDSTHDPLEPEVDSDSETEEATIEPVRERWNLHVDTSDGIVTPTRTMSTSSKDNSRGYGPAKALSTPGTVTDAAKPFVIVDEITPLMPSGAGVSDGAADRTYSNANVPAASAITPSSLNSSLLLVNNEFAPPIESTEPEFSRRAFVIQTVLISFTALLISVRITSVATLWNLVGSSACIILGFILPSACYLKIRRKKPLGLRMCAAWGLLFTGIIALVVCTMESFTTLSTLQQAPKADVGVAPGPQTP